MYLILGLALAATAAVGFSLYVSEMVGRGALRPTKTIPPLDLEILQVSASQVRLRPLDPASGRLAGQWAQDGVFGLRWSAGHGRVGRILDNQGGAVAREWSPHTGTLRTGDLARIDWSAFPFDPEVAFGLSFRPVRYRSRAGEFEGFVCDGSGPTWVLFLHGKRAAQPRKPPYAYPILPLAAGLGLTCFDLTYRNDAGAPPGDGLHWYGREEWEDLEAAARYAIDHGARRLILVGYSMGGAIVASFLYRSALAERVVGAILDAPVLDLRSVIEFGIRRRGIPRALVLPGLWMARIRFGLDWNAFDYLRRSARLRAPLLLVHGAADPVVPVETSDRLAALRPDLITYLRVPEAAHANSWNLDPERYESAVRSFLEDRAAADPGTD